MLYSVVAQNLEKFLARREELDRPVHAFVEQEFQSFLACGILERGFLRLPASSLRFLHE